MDENFLQTLHRIINILNKYSVNYYITGGFAAYLYGSNREIHDIDIDITESDMQKIYSDIKDYISFGPEKYSDGKRDLKSIITIYYCGQEIDISVAEDQKIYDDIHEKWVEIPLALGNKNNMQYDGLELSVIDPQYLLNYKKLLGGEHQRIDVRAIQMFIDKLNIIGQ